MSSTTLQELLDAYYWACEYNGTDGYKTETQAIKDIESFCQEIAREARHDELNKITKAEDYVYTASNEDNKYEFNLEVYCENRHQEIEAELTQKPPQDKQ